MEPVCRILETCGSTNEAARLLGEAGAPEGSWVSARLQTQGRGRLGRVWSSEPGNLFLSTIVRTPKPSHWTWVPLAAAVGLARYLKTRFPDLQVQVKWPNDLVTANGKLSGILCESVGSSSGAFLIVGLGLNCLHAPQLSATEGLTRHATSLTRETGTPVSADAIRSDAAQAILASVRSLARGAEGAREIAAEYARLALLRPGMRIEWDTSDGRVLSGEVRGLGPSSELRVQAEAEPAGEQALYAEEIRIRAALKAVDESPA
ncbi:MAG: biotin--[acetyl-CoA-carboxylase] ligase [Bdellovibrionales bacterium GWB1_55_8]|nr:MAG: biotin--[acetyl-CoA-carboxylase] ligase [Bdellovibrionales bacterium GWB1_55_8]